MRVFFGMLSMAAALALVPVPASAAKEPEASRAGEKVRLPSGVMFRINGRDIPKARFVEELSIVQGDTYRETFISHVLVEDKARSAGISVTDAEVESYVKKNIDQLVQERFAGSQERMEGALAERGMTFEGLGARLRVEGRYDLLLDRLVLDERVVGDETLQRVFEEKYGKGGVQTIVRHIRKNVLVAASQAYGMAQYEQEKAKIEDESRRRAEQALARLRGGEAFEKVMAEMSDDPRKSLGGMLGAWKGRYGAEFDQAAAALNDGEMSGIIKSPDGFRILQCTGTTRNEEIRASHILIATGARGRGRSEAEARAKAERLLARIRAKEDFAQLAKDNSDDPASVQRGGDLGFFGRRAMVKEFEDAAYALQPGQVSEVVKSPYGFHIIRLEEKRTVEEKPLRQILVSTQFSNVKDRRLRPTLEAEARGDLRKVVQDLASPGAAFAELAKTRSDDGATREEGGLIRNWREGIYGGEFDEAVRTMHEGDPPRIVKDAAGNLHLVLVEGTVRTEFGKVRESLLQSELQKPVSAQEKSEMLGRLRAAASVLP